LGSKGEERVVRVNWVAERWLGEVGEGRKEVGERRKSRDQDFWEVEGGVGEP
jgi:hypothetical protein